MAKKVHVLTGCRDCKMCAGGALTGAGRSAGRAAANVMTLGVTAIARKQCKICGHPMSEHASSAAPAGWYPVVGGTGKRYWDGEKWTVTEAEFAAQQQQEQQEQQEQPTAFGSSGLPPAGWLADPDDAAMLRWWDGAAWGEFRKPTGT